MRALGRQLVNPFPAFWDAFASEIPVGADAIERGLTSVFGDQGVEYSGGFAPRWLSLPDDDLAYHVARELTHLGNPQLSAFAPLRQVYRLTPSFCTIPKIFPKTTFPIAFHGS